MTPFRMRLFLVVFLSVAAAIAVNALYLQHAPSLAVATVQEPPRHVNVEQAAPTAALPKQDPIVSESAAVSVRQAEAGPGRGAGAIESATRSGGTDEGAPRGARASDARPSQPSTPPPARLVRAIQRELQARGYAGEAATGMLSVGTRAAILAYEFDEGMPLTGEASEAILKSLIFGRVEGKTAPGSSARFEERRALIAKVQEMLAAMGYASGPADGRLDAKTRDAIRRFESDRNLTAQGRLTERVLLEMVIVAGRPINANG